MFDLIDLRLYKLIDHLFLSLKNCLLFLPHVLDNSLVLVSQMLDGLLVS